jgi:diadenosine tetraphosphate (Ap4A) HIT family hydrolase
MPWNDLSQWSALCSGEACPICRRGRPLDVVAELEVSWVTMQEAAPVRGYVCLVSRIHAVELHDLSESAASAFMRDARKVSRAIATITSAVKLNYEIHGNSIPHLHMHFFPRFRGDPFEGRPIDPRSAVRPVYSPGEFDEFRDVFIKAIASIAEPTPEAG